MTPTAPQTVTATTAGALIDLSGAPDGIGAYALELRNASTDTVAWLNVAPQSATAQAYRLPAASGTGAADGTNIRRLGAFRRGSAARLVTASGTASVEVVVEWLTDEAP